MNYEHILILNFPDLINVFKAACLTHLIADFLSDCVDFRRKNHPDCIPRILSVSF